MVDNAAVPSLRPVAISLFKTFWHDARSTVLIVVGTSLMGAVAA